jgi:hypothetical protein
VLISGDTNPRLQIGAGGAMIFGPGNAAGDITLDRYAVNALEINGSLRSLTAGSYRGFTGLVTGDTFNRYELATASATSATLSFGSGSATPDAQLARGAVGAFEMSYSPETQLWFTGNSTSIIKTRYRVQGDADYRLQIRSDGALLWGGGATAYDASLARNAVGLLVGSHIVQGLHGIATFANAGAPTDATFTAFLAGLVPPIGTIVYDSTNSKLWVRTGTNVYKGVAIA